MELEDGNIKQLMDRQTDRQTDRHDFPLIVYFMFSCKERTSAT